MARLYYPSAFTDRNQVIIGYMGSAALVVAIIVVYYARTFDATEDPFRIRGDDNSVITAYSRSNQCDLIFSNLSAVFRASLSGGHVVQLTDKPKQRRDTPLQTALEQVRERTNPAYRLCSN